MGQVAIYCRVSTDDQSCSRQERDLRAFAKRAGHEIVAVLKELRTRPPDALTSVDAHARPGVNSGRDLDTN